MAWLLFVKCLCTTGLFENCEFAKCNVPQWLWILSRKNTVRMHLKHRAKLGQATVQTQNAQVGGSRSLHLNWQVRTSDLPSLPMPELPQKLVAPRGRRWRQAHWDSSPKSSTSRPCSSELRGYICIQGVDLISVPLLNLLTQESHQCASR